MWIGFLAEPVLLLFLLFDIEISDTRQLEDTMGVSEDNRAGTVGAHPRSADLEHESVRCRCEQ